MFVVCVLTMRSVGVQNVMFIWNVVNTLSHNWRRFNDKLKFVSQNLKFLQTLDQTLVQKNLKILAGVFLLNPLHDLIIAANQK